MDSTAPDPPSSAAPAARTADGHVGHAHAAAVVASEEERLATALPFVEEGLRAGDLVVLSSPPERAAVLAEALGERAALVEHQPGLTLLGARPPDALALCRRYLQRAERSRSGRLRVLADVDFGDDPADWREGQRFESVVNRLMDDVPVTSVCVYDERRLPAQVVHSAAVTHPLLVHGERWVPSRGYQEPEAYVPALPPVRAPIEDTAPVAEVEDAPGLATLRRWLGGVLAEHVQDPEQRGDLHLAAAEIAANAFRHGARPVSARLWTDGERLVCAVSDAGTSYRDPLSGFVPAYGDDFARGGMGLWLARTLWDHVDVLPGPDGLTVRLSTRLR